MGCFGDTEQAPPQQFDPLYTDQAKKLREGIFNELPYLAGAATGAGFDAAAAARKAAAGMAPVAQFGRQVMGGQYLHSSPELDRALATKIGRAHV